MNKKKHPQCQIIYVTSQDKKDVVYVIVIFILKKLLVHAVQLGSGQSHEVKDNRNNDEALWNLFLEEIISGT